MPMMEPPFEFPPDPGEFGDHEVEPLITSDGLDWNVDRKMAYLKAKLDGANVKDGCLAACISYDTLLKWRTDDPLFHEKEQMVKELRLEAFEDDLLTRAEKSDLLAIFVAKALLPERYSEKLMLARQEWSRISRMSIPEIVRELGRMDRRGSKVVETLPMPALGDGGDSDE